MSPPAERDESAVSVDAVEAALERVRFYEEKEARVASGILDVCKNAFWVDAVNIYGIWIAKGDDGWYLMLKGRRHGRYLVAYFNAATYADVLETAVTAVDSAHAEWRRDKKPPH